MSNRILQVTMHDRSVVPAEAEVWVTVIPDHLTPTTEVRGRLMGPRCPYANTVEVAYPLRPLPPSRAEMPSLVAGAAITRRVVIPEASLWEPESPFLYEGPVELWQDGQRCDRLVVRHGLRTFALGPRGLRVNGRPLTLRGRVAQQWSEEEVRARRDEGYNLLVGPLGTPATTGWDAADRLGLLVLGSVNNDADRTASQLAELGRHPSCLGWVIDRRKWEEAGQSFVDWVLAHAGGGKVGVELERPPQEPLPRGNHFLICPAENAAPGAGSGSSLVLKGCDAANPLEGTVLGVLDW
jgi:hypothetical protein